MTGECPAIELLAAYIDHMLTPEEQGQIEAHLVECDLCLRTIVQTFKAKEMLSETVSSPIIPEPAKR